jgi:transcriptional regulator with XRE-family HTH domain
MISVQELIAARILLGWSQSDLARASGVSKGTIARLEMAAEGMSSSSRTCSKLADALDAAGVAFIADGEVVGGGPGVRLRSSGARSRVGPFLTDDER